MKGQGSGWPKKTKETNGLERAILTPLLFLFFRFFRPSNVFEFEPDGLAPYCVFAAIAFLRLERATG